MKKLFIYLILIFSLSFFTFSFAKAYDASDYGWKIDEFNVTADIESNRHVTITEEIKVDFDSLEKHGIYRYIPYTYYRNSNNYSVRISIDSITDENGKNINFEESRSGGNVELKIGDADKTISGKHDYIIKYNLERVINSFADHDELYWNVTGNDWPVEIDKSKITINWPEGAEIQDNVCYVGSYGENAQECEKNVSGSSVTFSIDNVLAPGEGFTIASAIKPGVIEQYSAWQIFWWFLADNWGYFIPTVVLILMIRKYLKSGKDPVGKKTIVPEFDVPDKLTPALLGTVYDEKVDTHDISAVIIDMAVKGYITIKELEKKGIFGTKDYEFTYTGKNVELLSKHEKEVMDGIFDSDYEKNKTVKLSSLREKFYVHIKDIKDDLYSEVVKKGYFEKNPSVARNTYLGIGFGVIAFAFFGVPFAAIFTRSTTSLVVGSVISGIIIIIFSFSMPKRTDKGVEVTRQINGFKLYMHTAERYRQKFNEKEKIFEKFLPYAMVFGIVKEWAEKFKDMQLERPDWYTGRGPFVPVVFANDISNMQNSVNATMVSAPSSAGSGGSGFSGGGSGGGFGGGGGGSW